MKGFIAVLVCIFLTTVLIGGCELSDELHLTGRQADNRDFREACAPAQVTDVTEDGTLGLSYNVQCSDGSSAKVDDRFPKRK